MQETELSEIEGNNRLYFLDVTQATPLRAYGHSVTRNGQTVPLPYPFALTIEECSDDLILWHWTENGQQQSHSHVDTVEDAMDWAEAVFGSSVADWKAIK